MSLPDVSDAVKLFEQTVTLRTTTRTQDDFGDDLSSNFDQSIQASIQVARPEELLVENVNRNVAYIKVHARFTFDLAARIADENVNFYILYKSKPYRIIQVSDWIDYGYSRCFAAEDKLDESQ